MQEYKKIKLCIKEVMQNKGITTYKLVKETELGYKTIQNYRDAKITRIDLDILAKICAVLDCNIEDVLKYKE